MLLTILAIVVLLIWTGLWLGNGFFWRVDRPPAPGSPPAWPDVIAVIPARNEEALIGGAVGSLRGQAYQGRLQIVVVDDSSDDATSEKAVRAGASALRAQPVPPGWTGKVWAMSQGVERSIPPDYSGYVLLCDADIEHGGESLGELVSRAENDSLDLASLMVRLRCESMAERFLIPAFVFFFRMLYPFRRVNDPADRLAGAAGGTMLVRMSALQRIGGLRSIRHEIIDDCSLAREIKRGGHRIWLGMSDTSFSTRGYGSTAEIVRMIARTAYTQLGYHPVRLAVCVLGLAVTFVAPVVLAFSGGWPALLGAAAWLLMAALYLPMVRFYRQSPLWALLLPATACVYLCATILSAWNHHRGRGGQWKGRAQSAMQASKD